MAATARRRHGATFQQPICRDPAVSKRPVSDSRSAPAQPRRTECSTPFWPITSKPTSCPGRRRRTRPLMTGLLDVHDRLNAHKLLGPSARLGATDEGPHPARSRRRHGHRRAVRRNQGAVAGPVRRGLRQRGRSHRVARDLRRVNPSAVYEIRSDPPYIFRAQLCRDTADAPKTVGLRRHLSMSCVASACGRERRPCESYCRKPACRSSGSTRSMKNGNSSLKLTNDSVTPSMPAALQPQQFVDDLFGTADQRMRTEAAGITLALVEDLVGVELAISARHVHVVVDRFGVGIRDRNGHRLGRGRAASTLTTSWHAMRAAPMSQAICIGCVTAVAAGRKLKRAYDYIVGIFIVRPTSAAQYTTGWISIGGSK